MILHISHGAGDGNGNYEWFVVKPFHGETSTSVAGTEITHGMAMQSLLDAGRAMYEVDTDKMTVIKLEPEDDGTGFHWLLTSAIRASKRGDGSYQFVEQTPTGPGRVAVLRYGKDGDKEGLLFDDKYIETESYMGYVGLMDMVDDGVVNIPAGEG